MGRGSIRRAKRFASWAVALGLGFAALPAAAQTLVPEGAQFQINTYTTRWQLLPSIAADAHGGFVVVWQSFGSSGLDQSFYSIQGQRFASNGSAEGSQFQVNTVATGWQNMPAVAAAPDGDFIVVWQSERSAGSDWSHESIQGQRYASDGTAQDVEFQVNTYTTEKQINPSVATAPDGDFVVVWESSGSSGTDTDSLSVQGQRYVSDGSLQGAQFQINTYTSFNQASPFVAMAPDGDFVVVWSSDGPFSSFGANPNIVGQRYASDGSAQGAEFLVNTYTPDTQSAPSVATAGDGDFVVAWRNSGSYGTGTSEETIQGQRFASDGSAQGAEFQVNTYTTSIRFEPIVAATADGAFVVVWMSYGSSGTDTSGWSVQGRRYASDGSAQGAEFQVNSYTTNDQWIPFMAAADGDFIVVWTSNGSSGTDTDSLSIQGQRFSLPAAVIPVPSMSPTTRFALGAALALLGATYALRRRA